MVLVGHQGEVVALDPFLEPVAARTHGVGSLEVLALGLHIGLGHDRPPSRGNRARGPKGLSVISLIVWRVHHLHLGDKTDPGLDARFLPVLGPLNGETSRPSAVKGAPSWKLHVSGEDGKIQVRGSAFSHFSARPGWVFSSSSTKTRLSKMLTHMEINAGRGDSVGIQGRPARY